MDSSDDGDRVDRARDGKVPKPHSVLSTEWSLIRRTWTIDAYFVMSEMHQMVIEQEKHPGFDGASARPLLSRQGCRSTPNLNNA